MGERWAYLAGEAYLLAERLGVAGDCGFAEVETVRLLPGVVVLESSSSCLRRLLADAEGLCSRFIGESVDLGVVRPCRSCAALARREPRLSSNDSACLKRASRSLKASLEAWVFGLLAMFDAQFALEGFAFHGATVDRHGTPEVAKLIAM